MMRSESDETIGERASRNVMTLNTISSRAASTNPLSSCEWHTMKPPFDHNPGLSTSPCLCKHALLRLIVMGVVTMN